MSLANSLQEFRDSVTKVNKFVESAYECDNNDNEVFSDEEKDFLVESAFLKLFICWEQFLEDAFCKYLSGASAIDGSSVVRFATPESTDLAHKMLIGTQKYVDWANVEIVKRLANIYFPCGNTISENIRSIETELADLKTIRNSCAHSSGTTSAKLDGLARRLFGGSSNNNRVRSIILSMDPSNSELTVLQNYQEKLDVIAENICSNQT